MTGRKTNVIRLLEAEGIAHTVHVYEQLPAVRPDNVFKTLVTSGGSNTYIVFCLPLHLELNWRQAAAVSGCRKLGLIPSENLLPLTGYERGGCSPLAMKKAFPTYLDATAQLFETILVSGGQIGVQVELCPADLLALGQKLLPVCEYAEVT